MTGPAGPLPESGRFRPHHRRNPFRDAQAARRTAEPGRTAGGVDANASKQHLYDLAKELDVKGRSSMTKQELVEAIDKVNRRETAKARR